MSGVDGRHVRREQNRESVLDALVGLFEAGVYQPSSGEIAARAGLSPRSLFRYFDDVDDLNRAAIDRELARARPLLTLGVEPHDTTCAKAHAVVTSRAKLFETIGPAARVVRVCAPRHPMVAAQLHESRSYLRHQLGRLFAPELSDGALLPAMDALCSFETYELLRRDQGLSQLATEHALEEALLALLSRPGGHR